MKPKIIVIQTSHHGFEMCREELEKLGLKRGEDFFIASDDFGSFNIWEPGQRQLFVTGSFRGSKVGVADMVQLARQSNPQLVCVSFALEPLEGPFDYHIPKEREDFAKAVKEFLDGALNRTEVEWTPEPEERRYSPWNM